jgi:methanogenesis imperfect marker protein 11
MRYILNTGTADLALQGSRFPAGISSCIVGDREISITYIGMGGGGVGAAACRSDAAGVLRSRCDPAGGGKVAGATIWLPRMRRVLIGVDDTDTPDEGATWTLVHNIARAVENEHTVYISHTIVQLYPVPFRTKNCVALVAEFATDDTEGLAARFRQLLETYTLSQKTGMAVYTGFSPSAELLAYGWKVKRGEVEAGLPELIRDPDLRIVMKGRGIVGAVAALPFYTRYEEALELCSGKS